MNKYKYLEPNLITELFETNERLCEFIELAIEEIIAALKLPPEVDNKAVKKQLKAARKAMNALGSAARSQIRHQRHKLYKTPIDQCKHDLYEITQALNENYDYIFGSPKGPKCHSAKHDQLAIVYMRRLVNMFPVVFKTQDAKEALLILLMCKTGLKVEYNTVKKYLTPP